MRVAVYSSVLYGEDFIVESLQSVATYVDRSYVVMMQRPWGNTTGVTYRGEWVPWPEKFDQTREKIAAMGSYQVEVVEAQKDSPWNRWGFAFDLVRQRCSPDEVLFIDPDCVFERDEALRVFLDWYRHPEYQWAAPGQIELWRTPAWQVVRPRSMVSLHRGDLSLLSNSTELTRPKLHDLQGRVHNLGFCCSPANMRWKHLTAMAFSPVIGESLPNPDWYEQTWLGWRPGMRNLEVSIGLEAGIAQAVPYDVRGLPESIKRRYDAGEWPDLGVK